MESAVGRGGVDESTVGDLDIGGEGVVVDKRNSVTLARDRDVTRRRVAVVNLIRVEHEFAVDPDIEPSVGLSGSVEPDVLTKVGPFARLKRPGAATDGHAVDGVAVREGTEGAQRVDLLLAGSIKVELLEQARLSATGEEGWEGEEETYLALAAGAEHHPHREAVLSGRSTAAGLLAAEETGKLATLDKVEADGEEDAVGERNVGRGGDVDCSEVRNESVPKRREGHEKRKDALLLE